MGSLEPRPPYTPEEIQRLYPSSLQLKLVQVLFRHGERTPVKPRFQDTGVPAYWPYCKFAAFFKAAVLNGNSNWEQLSYRREVESMDKKGGAAFPTAVNKEYGNLCLLGELTDVGRESTLALGQRLRHLYINQLNFFPKDLSNPSQYYLRASPLPRTLTSLHQVITGIYPTAPAMPPISIPSRSPYEENLYPNEQYCQRLTILARAFANLAAEKWNPHPDMQYLQSRIGRYLETPIAVDGKPRLSGIKDHVNSTSVHGPEVKLPKVFYEPRVRQILNDIVVDEWFTGFAQSSEYRRLGAGPLLEDLKGRMVAVAKGDSELKFALYGCHDTTVGALLASLGVLDGKWPSFTSNVAIELFKGPETLAQEKAIDTVPLAKKEGWGWGRWFGPGAGSPPVADTGVVNGYYIRLRYNDKPVIIKGCRPEGRHLEGDESLCTFAAFKAIVEKIIPEDWRGECNSNLDKTGIPPVDPVPE